MSAGASVGNICARRVSITGGSADSIGGPYAGGEAGAIRPRQASLLGAAPPHHRERGEERGVERGPGVARDAEHDPADERRTLVPGEEADERRGDHGPERRAGDGLALLG